MAILAGAIEPFLRLLNIDAAAIAREQHFRQLELRFGNAKGGCGLEIQLPGLAEIAFHRAVRNATAIVAGQRDQRIDEIAGILGTGLDALLGNLAVNLEGFQIVFGDAITIGIHIGQRPAGARMALFSGIAIRFDGLVLAAVLVGGETELEESERA